MICLLATCSNSQCPCKKNLHKNIERKLDIENIIDIAIQSQVISEKKILIYLQSSKSGSYYLIKMSRRHLLSGPPSCATASTKRSCSSFVHLKRCLEAKLLGLFTPVISPIVLLLDSNCWSWTASCSSDRRSELLERKTQN